MTSIEEYKEYGLHHPWWINDEKEKYWFESVEINSKNRYGSRDKKIKGEIGKNIFAPHYAPANPNKRIYSYSLVNFVKANDIVFHYVVEEKSIIGFSYIYGKPFNDKAIWSSEEPVDIFKAKLKNYIPLENRITLDKLRDKHENIINFLKENSHIKYAPFHKGSNIINEGFFFKFPVGILKILNLINESEQLINSYSIKEKKKVDKLIKAKKERAKSRNKELVIKNNPYDGTIPQQSQNNSGAHPKEERDYFEIALQTRFVEYLEGKNFVPQSKDIGGFTNDIFLIEKNTLIEAKSSTSTPNVRMAIGQIKHYNYLLSKNNQMPSFSAALFPEKPSEDILQLLMTENIYCIWEIETNNFENNFENNFFD